MDGVSDNTRTYSLVVIASARCLSPDEIMGLD